MSEKFTSNKSETDWARLNAMTDEDIDFSDCPEVTSEQFAKAVVRHGVAKRRNKPQVTVTIDSDILEWFKSQDQSYQTRINSLLRSHMEAHQ